MSESKSEVPSLRIADLRNDFRIIKTECRGNAIFSLHFFCGNPDTVLGKRDGRSLLEMDQVTDHMPLNMGKDMLSFSEKFNVAGTGIPLLQKLLQFFRGDKTLLGWKFP